MRWPRLKIMPLIALVPVSLRSEGDDAMNNQVSAIRVDLATEIAALPARFKAIHASSESAKAVVRELKPVLGVDTPVAGSPLLMRGLASLLGRSELITRLPTPGNVGISNVPGPPVTLYIAGARLVHYYPVSIPYHAMGLNITVQSYAGSLEFGLTACRRVLTQEESYELVGHLKAALKEIETLPSIDAAVSVAATTTNERGRVDAAGASGSFAEVTRPARPKKMVRTATSATTPRRRAAPANRAPSPRKERTH